MEANVGVKPTTEGAQPKFALKLANFEGPLDLLLHLIEKENFDITAISLVQVTDQYMALLHADESLDPADLADFIVIGSKLLYLKSRALLPRVAGNEPEEEDEVAVDLTEMLQEYRKYKEAARLFREREEQGLRAFPRQASAPAAPLASGLDGVTTDVLLSILQEALSRRPKEEPTPIRAMERQQFSLRDKIEIVRRAMRGRGRVSFRRLIQECRSRVEVIVQFLAVLEMIKGREVVARQDALFADIELLTPELAALSGQPDAEAAEASA